MDRLSECVLIRDQDTHRSADFLIRAFRDCFCKSREIFEATESARDALRNEPVQDWDLFERCAREVAARRVWNQASEVLNIIDEEATRRLQDRDLKQQLEVGTKVTAGVQKKGA